MEILKEFRGQCIYLRGEFRRGVPGGSSGGEFRRSSGDSVFISAELHKLSPEYPTLDADEDQRAV